MGDTLCGAEEAEGGVRRQGTGSLLSGVGMLFLAKGTVGGTL